MKKNGTIWLILDHIIIYTIHTHIDGPKQPDSTLENVQNIVNLRSADFKSFNFRANLRIIKLKSIFHLCLYVGFYGILMFI